MDEPFDRKLSDEALQDLANIYEFIAEKKPAADGLGAFPLKQRCIYFRSVGNELRVLRVLHGRQDVTADHFKD